MPIGFDFQPRTRVIFGAGAVDRIGELARAIGTNALLVTDPGIVAAGHVERARRGLDAAGVSVTIFDRVRENPTTREVDQCLEVARAVRPELIIGLGGGSSMDTAKGCNFILTNGGRMQDYWGVGKATKPMLPLIAVPTTAGTGSECQSFALIADERMHQKMACGDPKAAPCVAILDPLLTVTQPRQVAASTGIDAVAHAVETAVTKKRNELSWLYSREAFRLTAGNLDYVFQQPDNLEARAAMQLGAAYAGTAIENSMLGAAHSAANPLTARFGVIHGQAVGIMLPHVVRFNARQPEVAAIYAELAKFAGLAAWSDRAEQAVKALIAQLESLLQTGRMPPSLSALNIPPSRLPKLAEEAAGQWTAQFNPRPIIASDFEAIYTAAL
ncbi:MAG TPA: iron-containing alcohol dehydrogenase [Terrimicrobiaceae bacterium]